MFRFIPSTIPHNILVVGCGGTGSRLVPLLAQFLRSLMREHNPRGWLGTPNLVLCDFDIIEEKNLLRQNFIRSDIGKNKAAVLADRYGRAYGVNIIAHTEAISRDTDVQSIFMKNASIDLKEGIPVMIIMCVDSVDARRDILANAFHLQNCNQCVNPSNVFVIDSGNEDNFGQVNFFNPVIITEKTEADAVHVFDSLPKLVTTYTDVDHVPVDLQYYINLTATPGQGSCADLDQTLAINAIIATTIMGVVQNYYYRKPMTYNAIHVGLDGGSYTSFNTVSNFKAKAIVGNVASFLRGVLGGVDLSLHINIRKVLARRTMDGYYPTYNLEHYYIMVKASEDLREEEEAKAKLVAEEARRKAEVEAEILSKKALKESNEAKNLEYVEAKATKVAKPKKNATKVLVEEVGVPYAPDVLVTTAATSNPVFGPGIVGSFGPSVFDPRNVVRISSVA